jgi:hypothetical protein
MSYAHTKSRVLQWIGIILVTGVFAGAYWYFQVQGSTLNQSRNDLVTNGLVGLWSFNGDDISGTTAYDRSGNGNNGTLTNGPAKVVGKIGQALDLDGTDDYVTVTDNSALDVGASADVSLSGWFNRESFTTDDTIIAKRNGIAAGDTGYILYIDDATDQLIFEVSDGTDEYSLTSVATFVTAGWNHFVVVWDQDSASGSELYINGVANTATDAGTIGNIDDLSNAVAFRTGAESDAGNPFDGKLDEIREYNRTLTTGDIQSLSDQGGGTRVNSAVSNAQGTGRLDSGLAGYWRLDDGSGTSATDSSSGGNTGTLNYGPTWGTGQIGGAVSYDNTNDSITVGDVVEPDYITMSAWINRNGNGTAPIITKGNYTGSEQYSLFVDYSTYGTVEMIVRAAGGGYDHCRTSSSGYTTGQWYHVTGTYNGTTCRIYVNGADTTNTVVSDTTSGAINSGASSLTIGSAFNGLLDEVRIYNRPLSPDEVAQLYRLTTPTGVDTSLEGYWSFNGQDLSGTTAYDRSGTGANGTLTFGPTRVVGKVGQALDFVTDNSYVDIPDNDALDLQSTLAGTFSAWIYTNGDIASGYQNIMIKGYATIPWQMFLYDNTLNLGYYSTTSGASDSGYAIPAGRWVHTLVTVSGSTVLFYVDGVKVATKTGQIGGDAGSAVIGSFNGISDFNGKIDEVRVYSRALSATEVESLYAQGQTDKTNSSVSQPQGTGRLDSGLALYWPLDDESGTSATDESTNNNTGTLTNGPTWTTGQIGSAVDFDGSDDYVTVADTAVHDVADSVHFTLTGWFNRDTFTTDDTIVAKRNGIASGDTGYIVYLDDSTDKVTFEASDGTDEYQIESLSTFTASGWNHFALVWDDNGASQSKIYINGTVESATTTGTFANVNGLANTVAFRIGSESDAGNPFDGKLDEVRLYNRALSADEVSQLYRLTTVTGVDTSFEGYWSFNGQDLSGTTAYDRSGGGNTGTLTNSPTRVVGRVGQALDFDGTDDYVEVNDADSLDIGDGDYLTLTGWFNRQSFSSVDVIMAKRNSQSASSVGYYLNLENVSDALVFEVSDGTDEYALESTTAFTSPGWHHFAVTWAPDSASDSEIYIDGVDDNAADTGTIANIGDISNTRPLGIGVNSLASGDFDGQLDELRVYRRLLSASEIAALYNQGR